MPSFQCYKCGYGSLVRSNFKFTQEPKPRPYCRAVKCVNSFIERFPKKEEVSDVDNA